MSLGILLPLWVLLTLLSSYSQSLHVLNGSEADILEERGDAASRRLLKLIQEKNEFRLIASSLISFFSVAFAILLYQTLPAPASIETPNSLFRLLGILIGISILLTLSCRIIPQMVALRFALPFCQRGLIFFFVVHQFTRPISRPITTWFETAFGYGKPELHVLSGEDLKAMADIGEAQGTIEEEERELIHSIVDFRDAEVREVMVSRLDMHAIPVDASFDEALELIQTSGHSRLPLYEEHLDNILGVVYAKDLLPYLSSSGTIEHPDWRTIARAPFFVPASKPLDELLKDFQSQKKHLAIVLDDYGGTAGLVTMEDVLEEIVGDIRDEFDDAEEDLHEQVSEYTHLFDARINLDDLLDVLDIELSTDNFDFETLGGLIFHLTGDIPEVGDEVTFESMKMRIESIENHRIGRVLVHIQPPTKDKTLVL